MKTFYDYLHETSREYEYRIRTVMMMDEDALNKVRYILSKYDLIDIDGPKRTIMQARPLDFTSMAAAEVYILDVKTKMPISSFLLQQEISHLLNIPMQFLIVRNRNDPNELQVVRQEELDAIYDIEAEKKLVPGPLLSDNPAYPEYEDPMQGTPIAGEEYNKNLLKYLAKVAADRVEIVPAIDPNTMNKYYTKKVSQINKANYGDDVVAQIATRDTKPIEQTSPYDNFDDRIKTKVSKQYINKNGEKILVTAKKIGE